QNAENDHDGQAPAEGPDHPITGHQQVLDAAPHQQPEAAVEHERAGAHVDHGPGIEAGVLEHEVDETVFAIVAARPAVEVAYDAVVAEVGQQVDGRSGRRLGADSLTNEL